MSEMSVDQVLMEMRRLTAAAQGGPAEAAKTESSGDSFATLLKQSVDQVNDMQQAAGNMSKAFSTARAASGAIPLKSSGELPVFSLLAMMLVT